MPAEVPFRTKPEIALAQIRRARDRGIPEGVVLADAGYGTDTGLRTELTKLGLREVAGIQSAVTVCKPGEGPKTSAPPSRAGTTAAPVAAGCEAPTGLGQRSGAVAADRGVETRDRATRGETETAVPVCGAAGSPGTSPLLVGRAARGRLVGERYVNPIL
jgi:hypothetical protein